MRFAAVQLAAFTVGIDPEIHVGPLTVAWHGLTIAPGVMAGTVLASRWASRRHGLPAGPLQDMAIVLAVAGFVGGRLFYAQEECGPLLGTTGFTLNGGFIAAAATVVLYVRVRWLDVRYLDAIGPVAPAGPGRRADRRCDQRGALRRA